MKFIIYFQDNETLDFIKYKDFEIDTNYIHCKHNYYTIATLTGSINELSIYCKNDFGQPVQIGFISALTKDNISTLFHVNAIEFIHDSDIFTLIADGDETTI